MKRGYFTSSDMMHFDTIEKCSFHELTLLYEAGQFNMCEIFGEDSIFSDKENYTIENFLEINQVCTAIYFADWWAWKNLYNVTKAKDLLSLEDIVSESGGWFEWLEDEQNPDGHWVRTRD